MWKLILLSTMCAVLKVNSYRLSDTCDGCRNIEYTRIKRGKYFSNPPIKIYNRPPNGISIKGPFSYTSPPGYTPDIGPTQVPFIRPYKVSRRPSTEVLEDEDINNIIRHLSKKDLNRLIEFATERERFSVPYRQSTEKNNEFDEPGSSYNNVIYKDPLQDYESSKYISGSDASFDEYKQTKFEKTGKTNYITNNHQVPVKNNNNINNGQKYFKDEQENNFSFLDTYIQKEINEMSPETTNIYSDSRTMQEEILPSPSNLRNNDFETSFTNNIPKILKPESSYELKNFANLPLMNYVNSKLDTVNSYNVPHYSVTSSRQQGSKISSPSSSPSLISLSKPSSLSPSLKHAPEIEPAPPASVARDQSDAHVKVLKIWTHKSKGTAYTLHDDGTLSLERPTRTKIKFA